MPDTPGTRSISAPVSNIVVMLIKFHKGALKVYRGNPLCTTEATKKVIETAETLQLIGT